MVKLAEANYHHLQLERRKWQRSLREAKKTKFVLNTKNLIVKKPHPPKTPFSATHVSLTDTTEALNVLIV